MTEKISGIINIETNWLPSRRFGAIAPIPAIILPYSKKPQIKNGTPATITLPGMLKLLKKDRIEAFRLKSNTNVPSQTHICSRLNEPNANIFPMNKSKGFAEESSISIVLFSLSFVTALNIRPELITINM